MNNEIFYESTDWSQSDYSPAIAQYLDSVLLVEADLNKDSYILDIGCHKGKWISNMYSKYKCKCFGLEPVLVFYNECANKDLIQYYNFGLTIEKENLLPMEVMGEVSKIQSSKTAQFAYFKNAKSFFEETNTEFDLVQVNIEGYEYDLLPYMFENNLFKYIKSIQIQFHCISNMSKLRFNTIKDMFLSNGFDMNFNYQFVWTKFSKK